MAAPRILPAAILSTMALLGAPSPATSESYEVAVGELGALRICDLGAAGADCADLGGVAWDLCASALHSNGGGNPQRDLACGGSDWDVVVNVADAVGNPAGGLVCVDMSQTSNGISAGGFCGAGLAFCGTATFAHHLETAHALLVFVETASGCGLGTTGDVSVGVEVDAFADGIPDQQLGSSPLRGYLIVA